MDRKGPRGAKPKNVPPPANLITLGNKAAGRSDPQLDKSSHGHGSSYSQSKGGGNSDRSRDPTVSSSSGMLSKKSSKNSFPGASNVVRPGTQKSSSSDMVNLLNEEWESIAEEVEPEDLIPFVEQAFEVGDHERIEIYLCGAVKSLKSQRMKPENYLCISLMYLAKTKPHIFLNSNLVVEAFTSLLRRDHSLSYKTKGSPPIAILAANILLAIFQDEKVWPDLFIRVFIDDSLSERLWVDHEDCKTFVDNIITGFRTKMPPKNLLYPDIGISSRSECSSPPVSSSSSAMEVDLDSDISLECKESMESNIINHYANVVAEVDEIVMEAVQHQLGLRHANVDAVARNLIRFLVTVSGILEVRRAVAPRLEMWLQSHKVQRHATELLMALCLNCNTHSQIDVEVISHIIRIRLKSKPIINQYMACLRELLGSHPGNISSVMKHTIYNELSQSRNPSNMNIISAIFQYAPEHAAIILAEEFLELLSNKDDFLRALRALLREIVRALRFDMPYITFCKGLMTDRKDSNFRESTEFKDRMFHSITDLVVLTMFVSVSPQVRESAAQASRTDMKESEPVRKFQDMVANIQTEALHWMQRIVPKCYSPSKEEFGHCLHKVLMFEAQEVYYAKDNWPVESDRALMFRLTAEAPVKQETLTKLLLLGVTKDQWIKPTDLMDLADNLIKRATSLHNEHVDMLHIQDTKVIELIFTLCPYIPPDGSFLPSGYRPPKTAISNLYWKAWGMILLITAHNPGVFGVLAWESYLTLRTLMEMCITNSFVFPPPTLAVGEKGEEMTAQELHLCARERQQILEFESHLAQKTITEQNSLLLSQLITMNPTGPARKPPPYVLDQLKAQNASYKIGHLLCRCRNPDFLLDIIQRQGASQSMPWLAELVQSSEGALSGLPVQCLCEFLLSETVTSSDGTVAARHHQLLQHLQSLLRTSRQDDEVSVEILEYFLRRLSSQQVAARNQAVRGLQLVVSPIDAMDVDSDPQDPHAWLLQHLPQLPGFASVRSVACQCLRGACQFETNPQSVSAYIRFLAVHTREDSLQDQALLVQDMAQLIVERCTMISAILPGTERPGHHFPHCHSTLKALLIIFINYMRGVRVLSRESYSWPESPDHVRIHWVCGEQAVMHILVVHAMVILLTYGPSHSPDLFRELLTTWFPEQQQTPTAFLVDTNEEALLLPDWLKLKMIRSTVPQLVDAALKDLEPSQLVLFIQSFGIPVESMTKLLCALDVAVNNSEEAVAAAVLDKSHKTYMSQLVEVQHQRGAKGGHAFAATLGERDDDIPAERQPPIPPLVTPLKVKPTNQIEFRCKEFTAAFLLQFFTNDQIHKENKSQMQNTIRILIGHLSKEISSTRVARPYLDQLIQNFNLILRSPIAQQKPESENVFVAGLHSHFQYSAPLFRVLNQLKIKAECRKEFLHIVQICQEIIRLGPNKMSPLKKVLLSMVQSSIANSKPEPELLSVVKVEPGKSPVKPDTKSTTTVCLTSEITVLNNLQTAGNQLEKQIQNIVTVAMKEGKTNIVIAALTRLLVSYLKIKSENNANEINSSIALLLDWLHVLDPELRSSPDNLRQLLLFGKQNTQLKHGGSEISTTGYNQAYLLAAFTHQATWKTLEETVHELLRVPSTNLDPSSVLDFIWAVLHVPKLWQGRERRTPRHIQNEPLLHLQSSELTHLAHYIVAECQQNLEHQSSPNYLKSRMSLLFYCIGNNNSSMQTLVEDLVQSLNSKPGENAVLHLLYQFYLKQPKIFRFLPVNLFDQLISLKNISNKVNEGQSKADVALHTLLTMLCTPQPGEDFRRRMHDLDVAMRKLAITHPLLVLRHLPLLSASLHGFSHLHIGVLQEKNYLLLFNIVIGLMELLQPFIFSPVYKTSFSYTLDSFIEVFDTHGSVYELTHMLVRLCHLLLAWVGSQATIAGTYLSKHFAVLLRLQNHHSDLTALRSLTAIAASRGTDHPTEELTTDESNHTLSSNWQGPPIHPMMLSQAREIQARLETSPLPEDQLDLLKKVSDFGDRTYNAILPMFNHIICEGILNSHKNVSRICWDLLARFLHFQPSASKRVSRIVLTALHNRDTAIAEVAIENLPEVILLLHDDAPDLLTAAFTTCLSSPPNTVISLSEALALLSIHTGA